jgi:hypothetical protein
MIKMTVSFRIAGDLIAPGEISGLTGLAPTSVKLDRGPRVRPFSSEAWEIAVGPFTAETEAAAGNRLGSMLRQLEAILTEPAERIRRYCAVHDLTSMIEIWIESSDGALPEINLAPSFEQVAANLEADIDIDLYLWLGAEWEAEHNPPPAATKPDPNPA